MSLDQNLFTLQVKPSETDQTVVDLVDPAGNVFYRKQRISGPVYAARLYDFVSQSLLVTATAPSATSKVKILELQNPSVPVELKASGTFTTKWLFRWEGHEFEWKREECYMIRKPDPPVLVAITKETPGRVQSASIQVLDYNLNRFDIDDRKGLELVILTSLLTFLDSTDPNNSKEDDQPVDRKKSTWTTLSPFSKPPLSQSIPTSGELSGPSSHLRPSISRTRAKSSPGLRSVTQQSALTVPIPISTLRNSEPVLASSPLTPPPTPPVHPSNAHLYDHRSHIRSSSSLGVGRGQSGVDLIAQMHALRNVMHEVTVHQQGDVEDYAKFCWRLLKDEAITFITIRSGSSSEVQKVLEVTEATKRIRFQKGSYVDLLQFVTYYPLPVGTTRQRLEERTKLLSMTPKQAKKAQEKKRKEEKKQKAKANLSMHPSLEIEELQIPPKSVQVRLSKVEIQAQVSPLQTGTSPESKGKANAQAPVPIADPRFLVQQPPSESPSRFFVRSLPSSESSSRAQVTNNRAAHQSKHLRPHSSHTPATQGTPPAHSAPVASSSNLDSSGSHLPDNAPIPGSSSVTHMEKPIARATTGKRPIGGPSQLIEAPPSYAELVAEGERPVDIPKHKQ
ncbi:hypothetical protein BDP27DRAFT_448509 [Rhodocollybia butyracea]|uniref:Uncharacterized protein n=1 Tax=Rhodocollybia butyracea TaxID=206335 RepID=A0A9P5TXS7_9AGAR|nr:hypothetical protein BDP27DRAFT_448509 [Rhodocollybia butyracea]